MAQNHRDDYQRNPAHSEDKRVPKMLMLRITKLFFFLKKVTLSVRQEHLLGMVAEADRPL